MHTHVNKETLVAMAPYLGYLKAHADLDNPHTLLGGPLQVTVTQTSGGVHLALPDYRRLDPRVFGTPEWPRAFAGTPIMTGVPPGMRDVKDNQYTQLNVKSPFGHANLVLPDGRYSLQALDATATDAAQTKDSVKMEASWKDHQGNEYTVKCSKIIPHGLEYPSFGGVMTNHILHGSSRIGTPLMPTEFVYVAFWGPGEVLKNGQVTDSNVLVHCMLTEYVRTTDYALAFDDQVTPARLQMHLIVPPVVVENGKFVSRDVKTGFMLENGKELPFFHVMFANLNIKAERTGETSMTTRMSPAVQQPAAVVDMTNQMRYVPDQVSVSAGSTVEWKNTSDLVHTVTAEPNLALKPADVALPKGAASFNSGDIDPNGTYYHTFNMPGQYRYFCIPHEADGMVGRLTVKPAS